MPAVCMEQDSIVIPELNGWHVLPDLNLALWRLPVAQPTGVPGVEQSLMHISLFALSSLPILLELYYPQCIPAQTLHKIYTHTQCNTPKTARFWYLIFKCPQFQKRIN